MHAPYAFDFGFGFLFVEPGAGRHPLCGCQDGPDHFASAEPGCEGATMLRQEGWAYDAPPAGETVSPLIRCRFNDGSDRWVYLGSVCGSFASFEAHLGWVRTTGSDRAVLQSRDEPDRDGRVAGHNGKQLRRTR